MALTGACFIVDNLNNFDKFSVTVIIFILIITLSIVLISVNHRPQPWSMADILKVSLQILCHAIYNQGLSFRMKLAVDELF